MGTRGIGTEPVDADRPVQDDRIPPDPVAALGSWLPGDDDPIRPTATLATVDAEGVPNARTVLLSSFAGGKAAFHTDATSAKVRELTGEPSAALLLFWPDHARQVVLRGPVRRTSAEEDRRAYARRSRYLQILAWLNTPDLARAARAERERAWAAFDHREAELRPPKTWVGYAIVPDSITIWEGSATTAGRRAHYRRDHGGWLVDLLPG